MASKNNEEDKLEGLKKELIRNRERLKEISRRDSSEGLVEDQDYLADGFSVYRGYCKGCGGSMLTSRELQSFAGLSLSASKRVKEDCRVCGSSNWLKRQLPVCCGGCGHFMFKHYTGDEDSPVVFLCREPCCDRFTE